MPTTIRLFLTISLILIFNPLLAAPDNSTQYGNFWLCNEGFQKSGDRCERIIAPQNAHVIGNMWMCDEGYRRVGNSCQRLSVPTNAYVIGNMWLCEEGYKKVGNSCQRLSVPANAYVIGNMWLCEEGYKKVGNRCEQLSESETQQREKLARIIAQQQEELRSRGASGQTCQTEYETGARVCLSVLGADLDCDENFSGGFYDNCEVEIDYALETDYRGSSSINTDVECEAEISYESMLYMNRLEDEKFSESHMLSSYGTVWDNADLDFSFFSSEEVYRVELDDAWCEIQNIYLN